MLIHAIRVCASGLLSLAAFAQQAPPDPATIMDSLQKQMAPLAGGWLNSADPRLQAWGAYTALRDRRTEAIPVFLEMLARYPVVEELTSQAEANQHDAMLGVLDALIQLGAQVPSADAQRIYPEFPVQSLILLSRSPNDAPEAAPALLAIFRSERQSTAAWLAAGDLLLQRRTDGFAAALVEGLTVHAQVTVAVPNAGGGVGGGSTCCGLAGSAKPKAGWPPVGVYSFGGCGNSLQPGATVLAPGADPAYYYRQVSATYQPEGGSLGCCRPDQDLVRQHFLTALLSASADDPPVRAHVSHTIEWQGVDAYRGELAAFIAEQRRVFEELTRRLGKQGLLSGEDARTLRPTLQIHVWDQRPSHEPALPALETLPDHVTVAPF